MQGRGTAGRKGVGVASADRMHLVSTEDPVETFEQAFMRLNPTCAIKERQYREILHEARGLAELLHRLRVERRSGVLTINFSQGSPSGALKWTEPAERKD